MEEKKQATKQATKQEEVLFLVGIVCFMGLLIWTIDSAAKS
jgi:hypothetical protein